MNCALTSAPIEIAPVARDLLSKLGLPEPQLSFLEALRRKLAQRNHIHLFRRSCDKTAKPIITNYPPASPFKVFDKSVWFGDSWDATGFGREFDFTRSFFEQFYELKLAVPVFNLQNVNTENADYCNSAEGIRRAYLAFILYEDTQDAYFSYLVIGSRDVYYSLYVWSSELVFYSDNVRRCYQCVALKDCIQCQDCHFCFQLENCQHCLFSSNLRNKKFYVHNRACSEEEYRTQLAALGLNSSRSLMTHLENFRLLQQQSVRRPVHQVQSEGCSGHNLERCNDCHNCFETLGGDGCADCVSFNNAKECYRCYGMTHTESLYEVNAVSRSTLCSFLEICFDCYDCHYCAHLHNCQNCFGCVGLRGKRHCLFNLQYSPEEYERLRAKVIAHMQRVPLVEPGFTRELVEYGQYFPVRHAYFPYNLTLAQCYLPLTKSEVLARGYQWLEIEDPALGTADNVDFPDDIFAWQAQHAVKTLLCPRTCKAFKIPKQVIDSFQQQGLALMAEHPVEYLKRSMPGHSFDLRKRISSQSGLELESVYDEQAAPVIVTADEYRAEFY